VSVTNPTPASEGPVTVVHEDKAVRFRRSALLLMGLSALVVLFLLSRMGRKVAAPAGADKKTVVMETPSTPVTLSTVKLGAMADTVEVSGDITALTEVTLSPKITARVLSVNAREGDSVRQGQLLVTLDTSDLDNQVRGAQAQLAAARATLTSAQEGLQGSKARASQARVNVQLTERTSNLAVQNARENLRSAQARLEVVKQGARTQERAVSQSAVSVAQANLDDAQTNYNRTQRMFQQGAIARSQVDTAETRLRVARAQLRSAQEQLSLVREGARPEEVTQAESVVAQARQGLQQAYENQQQVAIRREEYRAALAAVDQARSAVRQAEAGIRQVNLARVNRSNAFIHAPVNGVVAARSVETGQVAAVGAPLMRITVPGTVYFSAKLAEKDLAKIKEGQTVAVRVDAVPNERFYGKVSRIYPTGDASRRTFIARVNVANAGGRLRPGMFARGTVSLSQRQDVVLVPKSALSVAGSAIPLQAGEGVSTQANVFVMKDGKAAKRAVRIGAPSGDSVEVLSGLAPGEKVITSGSRIEEGEKVAVTG
jgi:HlyD family secretion protein